jgi:putative restriction endonuclease
MATTGVAGTNWTRPQTLAALNIYFQLPFGKLHRETAEIKQLAQWIGRTPDAVAMKLGNLAGLDPLIAARGLSGLKKASNLDKAIWAELQNSWDPVALEAAAEYQRLAVSHGINPDADLLEEVEAIEPPPMEQGRTPRRPRAGAREPGALPSSRLGELQRPLLHVWPGCA